MHVPGNGKCKLGQLVGIEIIISIGRKVPFRRKAEAIVKRQVRIDGGFKTLSVPLKRFIEIQRIRKINGPGNIKVHKFCRVPPHVFL